MGLFDWFSNKKKVKEWKGRPLYRKGNQTYWKGYRADDDLFYELMHNNPEEVAQYNQYIRKFNKKIKHKRRQLR